VRSLSFILPADALLHNRGPESGKCTEISGVRVSVHLNEGRKTSLQLNVKK